MTAARCLELVGSLRAEGLVIPLIVMTYYNPILAYGPDGFVQDAAAAGLDGLIAVDVPPEEAEELESHLSKLGYAHWEESSNPAYAMFLA